MKHFVTQACVKWRAI